MANVIKITIDGETTEFRIDENEDGFEIEASQPGADEIREATLRKMDRHYQSIGGECKCDENGHVYWNSKIGLCGAATMIF